MIESSRRLLLASISSALSLGVPGCQSQQSPAVRYRLTATSIPSSLHQYFLWQPRGPFKEDVTSRMQDLVSKGSLTTAGFTLSGLLYEEPRYVKQDGRYYEITQEQTGTVTRDHWIFWFDLIDGDPPPGAEVVQSGLGTGAGTDLNATYGLSQLDVRVVENAAGEVFREGPPLHDIENAPPGRRGHVFLHRTPNETRLLPEPPFTHIAFDTNGAPRYARAVTQRSSVELQQYTYTARPVASSPDEYVEYLHQRFLNAEFDAQEVSTEQREILDSITAGGGRYDEHRPLSAAMKAVLRRLGLLDLETPESGMTAFSNNVYFRYKEAYYQAQLQIFR